VPAAALAPFDSSVDITPRGIQAAQEAKPCSAEPAALERPGKGQRMKINQSFEESSL